jgi:predicted lactoylglutathione lyase
MIEVQRTDFVAVPTRDRGQATAFYGETLGLTKNPSSTDMLRVPDVAAAKEKLQEAGVEFVGETWDSGVCHGAVFRDPDGNSLGIHHRYAPYLDGTTP